MSALGLIIVGDYALATGTDQHIAFTANTLAQSGHALAWSWLIPAHPVELAAALYEAWQRPCPVACFGGLGDGADDYLRATIEALQQGRDEVGLARLETENLLGLMRCGNVYCFPGDPSQAHPIFQRWWAARLTPTTASIEVLPWPLPEVAAARAARQQLRQDYPLLRQRLLPCSGGGVVLALSGPSKGKIQAARKFLQQHLRLKQNETKE